MGLPRVVKGKGQMKITDSYAEVKSIRGKRKIAKTDIQNQIKEDSVENLNDGCRDQGANGLAQAKRALCASTPGVLPRRNPQIEEVYEFLRKNLIANTGASIYISGAPGTGKTAVVQHVLFLLENLDKSHEDYAQLHKIKFTTAYINCMNVSIRGVFVTILDTLKTKHKSGTPYENLVARCTRKQAKPIVLILDEMDQILTSDKNVLYQLFELARMPGSKLILIGIANSLDLTVRHLPMLSSSPKSMSPQPRTPAGLRSDRAKELATSFAGCKLMHFPPYQREDIEEILSSRMKEVGSELFETGAIKYVAAKIASTTGDVRKALNACQKALDMCVKDQRPALKSTADDGMLRLVESNQSLSKLVSVLGDTQPTIALPGFNASSPKKMCLSEEKIGIVAMSKAIAPQKDDGGLPLQQKIILATLLKINKDACSSGNSSGDGVGSPIAMNVFYDLYRKICSDKGLSWIDRSELSSVCGLLEDRSLIHVSEGTGTLKRTKNGKNKSGIFIQPDTLSRQIGADPLVASIVD